MATQSKAPSTPPPVPYGKIHPCTEHKVIREQIAALKLANDKTDSKRWSLIVAGAGSLLGLVTAVVVLGIYFGELETNDRHRQRELEQSRQELRSLREDMLATERVDVQMTSKTHQAVTEIKVRLDSLDRRVESLEESQNRARPRSWQRSSQ